MKAAKAISSLLAERAATATICPSEAARLLAGPAGDWRAEMETVHRAAREMAAAGEIVTSWKGEPRAVDDGPYRIGKTRP